MIRATKYIQKLKETSSGNEKKVILRKAAVEGCFELFEAFQMAYSNRKVYGVKKLPLIDENGFTEQELQEAGAFGWEDFISLADQLETRKLTGNAARDAILKAAENSCIVDWNSFYRNILAKDMRCGVTETTVNKVLLEVGGDCLKYLIPVCSVQLADDSKKHPKKMKGKKAIDPKLDGIRITALLDKENNSVELYTRNGLRNENFPHIENYLKEFLKQSPLSLVIDGEMVSASFQELMTQANRKYDVDTSTAYYAIFDIVPMAEFLKGKSVMGLKDRHEILADLESAFNEIAPNGALSVVNKLFVDLDTEEGNQKMVEFYNEMVGLGYEGIMVKDINGVYECKRSQSWLKWKPSDSADLTITAIEPGKEGKKRDGVMGNMIVEGTHDGKTIYSSVGTGFNDKQLKEFWENRDALLGEIVEIEFDSITQNKNSDTWSLRFPRFKCFRSLGAGKI